MPRVILCLLWVVLAANAFAQPIDLARLDHTLMSSLLIQHLDSLRATRGFPTLLRDEVLTNAAADHAAYMAKRRTVGHRQKTPRKATPYQRVVHYGGAHDRVQELCYVLNIEQPHIYNTGQGPPIATYQQAAAAVFLSWGQHPTQVQAILDPMQRTCGLGFAYNKKSQSIYATLVMAALPFAPPSGLTIPNYEVQPYSEVACRRLEKQQTLAALAANYAYVAGDSVYLNFPDGAALEELLRHKEDGFLVDVVWKQQFRCDKPNNLHGAPAFDGFTFPPVYLREIMRRKQTSGIRIPVGRLPVGLPADYQINVVTVKNNCACAYSEPIHVERAYLPTLEVRPAWDTASRVSGVAAGQPKPIFPNTMRREQQEFSLFYDVNTTELDTTSVGYQSMTRYLRQHDGEVQHIIVQSFSSVEGSSAANQRLFRGRSAKVKALVERLSDVLEGVDESPGAENWELFYRQVRNTDLAWLRDGSKAEVKRLMERGSFRDSIAHWLQAQRYTQVTVFTAQNVTKKIVPREPPLIRKNDATKPPSFLTTLMYGAWEERYVAAVREKAAPQAHLAQSELIKAIYHRELSFYEEDRLIKSILLAPVPFQADFAPVVSNQLAVFLEFGSFVEDSLLEFWTNSAELAPDYTPLQYNVCALAVQYWNACVPVYIKPEDLQHKLEELQNKRYEPAQLEKLMLGYYTKSADYYFQRRDFAKRGATLRVIHDKLMTTKLTQEEALPLAQYFLGQYKFEWAWRLLEPMVNSENLEVTFTMLPLLMIKPELQAKYAGIIRRAADADGKRFCVWLNRHYQALRYPAFRETGCVTCTFD